MLYSQVLYDLTANGATYANELKNKGKGKKSHKDECRHKAVKALLVVNTAYLQHQSLEQSI